MQLRIVAAIVGVGIVAIVGAVLFAGSGGPDPTAARASAPTANTGSKPAAAAVPQPNAHQGAAPPVADVPKKAATPAATNLDEAAREPIAPADSPQQGSREGVAPQGKRLTMQDIQQRYGVENMALAAMLGRRLKRPPPKEVYELMAMRKQGASHEELMAYNRAHVPGLDTRLLVTQWLMQQRGDAPNNAADSDKPAAGWKRKTNQLRRK